MYQMGNEKIAVLSNNYRHEHNVLVCNAKSGMVEKKLLISLDSCLYNLKITLSDEADAFFLYCVNITHDDYLVLKSEQGLLINFPEFPERIVNLLRQCITGRMYLQLVKIGGGPTGNFSCHLEFIERNDFKNLIHLQLKMFACETDAVMANISLKMNAYRDHIQSLEQKNDLLSSQIASLTQDNENLSRAITEKESRMRDHNSELIQRIELEHRTKCNDYEHQLTNYRQQIHDLNETMKELNLSQKNLKTTNTQYGTTIENMNKEIMKLENELKQIKSRNGQVDEEFRIKDAEIQASRMNVAVLEQSLREKNDIIAMLKDQISRAEREIEHLRDASNHRSEHEIKMKMELKQTYEDLDKANEIISQNNLHYEQLKKKFNVVSKISLNLEKDNNSLHQQMEDKCLIIKQLQEELVVVKNNAHALEKEHERHIKALRTKDESLKEMKKLIDVQYEKIKAYDHDRYNKENASPNLAVGEWKPLPSPAIVLNSPANASEVETTPQIVNNKSVPLSTRAALLGTKKANPLQSAYFRDIRKSK